MNYLAAVRLVRPYVNTALNCIYNYHNYEQNLDVGQAWLQLLTEVAGVVERLYCMLDIFVASGTMNVYKICEIYGHMAVS